MNIDNFKPTFLIQIEGQTLSADITQEITAFVFEELDVLKLPVTGRNLQFVDDPLFQEGNEIVTHFGDVGNRSDLQSITSLREVLIWISYRFDSQI